MTAPSPVVPRLLVDGPPQPVPHRFPLFAAANVQENADHRVFNGVEYEAVCSTQVDPYPAPCEPTVPDEVDRVKKATGTSSFVTGTPWGLVAADSRVLGRSESDVRRQLRQRFLAGEQAAAERVIETGMLGNTPNLTQEAAVLPGTVDLVDAVGLLEQWLADTTGGVGVIHAPKTVAPRAKAAEQLQVSGPRAQTVLGSTWAFGTGYTGTAPAGQTDDGSLWLYATPPVTVRRSALIEPADWGSGAFDRATNSGFLLVERLYVVDWPCGAAAIKTSTSRPGYTPEGAAS